MRQIETAREECYCPVEVALLPEIRHAPYREAPEATLQAIADFANRLLRDHHEGEIRNGTDSSFRDASEASGPGIQTTSSSMDSGLVPSARPGMTERG
jgi:hypothetical protein